MIPNRQFGAGRVGMTTTLSSTVAAIVLIQAQIYLRLYPPCSQWDRTNRHSGEMFKPRWSTPRFPPLGLVGRLPAGFCASSLARGLGQASYNPKHEWPVEA